MENPASMVYGPSSSAAGPSSVSKQPTYTTAGTIYKPESTQPLQPPTRRGRSSKVGGPGSPSDLVFLPKAFLAGLPLKAGIGRSTAVQQYNPLQQNYDRAVNPLEELDNLVAKMPTSNDPSSCNSVANSLEPKPSLLLQPSNSKIGDPAGEFSSGEIERADKIAKQKDMYDMEDTELGNPLPDSEDMSDWNDPIRNMTVHSLHNLASYPNPNRDKARRVLNVGQTAKHPLQSSSITSRSDISSGGSTPMRTPAGQTEVDTRSPRDFLFGQSNNATLRRPQSDKRESSDDNTGLDAYSTNFYTASQSSCERVSDAIISLSTFAYGPGGPRPLTAGPPGQRQYRPSTFESTFRALQTLKAQQSSSQAEIDSLSAAEQMLFDTGIEDNSFAQDDFSAIVDTPIQYDSDNHFWDRENSMMLLSEPYCPSMQASSEEAFFVKYTVQYMQGRYVLAPAWTRVPGCEELEIPSVGYWHGPNSSSVWRYKPGTDRLTDEEIQRRNEKIQSLFCAGRDFMWNPSAHFLEEKQTNKSAHSLGVIGDRRKSSTRM